MAITLAAPHPPQARASAAANWPARRPDTKAHARWCPWPLSSKPPWALRQGIGATIKPMAAALLEGELRKDWRTLRFSDASMKRPNYVYSVVPDRLSPAAAAVRAELKDTIRQLVHTGRWKGVEPLF